MSETCVDCGRRGRVRYVADTLDLSFGPMKFGACRRVLCDVCVENYEQPQAALAAEHAASHGFVRTVFKQFLRGMGEAP